MTFPEIIEELEEKINKSYQAGFQEAIKEVLNTLQEHEAHSSYKLIKNYFEEKE